MSFNVSAEAYDRFMGRFSQPLGALLVDHTGVRAGQRVLDVGCGTGALTRELVARLGAGSVAAIDPSPSFVATARQRFPGVDVRAGTAEDLPWPDDSFDGALAGLVVHFMADPVAGLAEMRRVTRPGGTVSACVWDYAGGTSPLSTFWTAATELDPAVEGEAGLAGARQGHLEELCAAAGLLDVQPSTLSVSSTFSTFDEWWETYTLGVGPSGAHVAGLDETRRAALRDRCAELLPPGPFEISARAWCVRATVA